MSPFPWRLPWLVEFVAQLTIGYRSTLFPATNLCSRVSQSRARRRTRGRSLRDVNGGVGTEIPSATGFGGVLLATSVVVGGNTIVTFFDGSTMALVGVSDPTKISFLSQIDPMWPAPRAIGQVPKPAGIRKSRAAPAASRSGSSSQKQQRGQEPRLAQRVYTETHADPMRLGQFFSSIGRESPQHTGVINLSHFPATDTKLSIIS